LMGDLVKALVEMLPACAGVILFADTPGMICSHAPRMRGGDPIPDVNIDF